MQTIGISAGVLALLFLALIIVKPKWVKITVGFPKFFGLTFEAGSGPPDSKEPGPRNDDDDEPRALASG